MLQQLWRAPPRLPQLQRPRTRVHAARCFSASPPVEKVYKRQVAIHVTALSDQGDGVGVDASTGVPVHVPFALPGEELLVEVWERDLIASEKWKASKREPKWPVFGQRVQELAASAHRTVPLCDKFFGACGGCKTQHLVYAEQLRHKQLRVEELFHDRSHSPTMQLRAIIGAESDEHMYAYRNKMEFTCSTGRWLLDSDKVADSSDEDATSTTSCTATVSAPHFPFTIGLFPVASTSVRRARQLGGKRRRGKTNASWSPRILSIDTCALQSEASNTVLQRLSTQLETSGLTAFNFQTCNGFLKQLVVRTGVNAHRQTEIMLGLVTTSLEGEDTKRLRSVVQALVDDFHAQSNNSDDTARIVSVVQRLDEQVARERMRDSTAGPREQTLVGHPFFHDTILDHTFEISFDSFFQPNTVQASRLYSEIQQTLALQQQQLGDRSTAATPAKKPVIWDMFCGVGSIGICMGQLGAKVYGFELVEAAVERARVNAERNGYDAATMQFFALDLTKRWDENAWSDVVERPNIVIVDPPRAGLHAKLIKMLRRLAPPQICYVSCNPESQVRDLELLCSLDANSEEGVALSELASYDVEFLQPVDMLPHTPHIETIAWLRKRDT